MNNNFALFGLMLIMAMANLFFPPIPLETATLFAGYLVGTGHGSLIIIILATTTGMFLSSMILFHIIKRYGLAVINRSPLQKLFSGKSYHRIVAWFKRYGFWAVFIGKLIPGMTLYAVICCGILQVETKKAAPVFFGSNLLFYSLLALMGNYLGKSWGKTLPWLTKCSIVGIILVGIITVGGLIRLWANWRKKRLD